MQPRLRHDVYHLFVFLVVEKTKKSRESIIYQAGVQCKNIPKIPFIFFGDHQVSHHISINPTIASRHHLPIRRHFRLVYKRWTNDSALVLQNASLIPVIWQRVLYYNTHLLSIVIPVEKILIPYW
jgi:hypothetical protein